VTQTGWQYTFEPSATAPFSFATGVAAERDGSGASYVGFVASGGPRDAHGILLAKMWSDLSVAWIVNLSSLPFDAITAVALSPSGDLFVTGGTFLTLGRKAFGQEDAFLIKIDKQTGSPLWATQAGGADSDYPTALAFDAAGNIYISGITLGSVADSVTNQGETDIFAMKFAPSGQLVSVWQTGTSADDEATSLAVDHCGDVLVGGYTRGALIPGHPSAGGEDMFVVKADLRPVPPGDDHDAQLASCIGLPSTCGPAGNDSCCASPEVAGGTYDRSYDVAGDINSGNMSYPATISDFRLDRYEVTVGRFRSFVSAGMGTQNRLPAAGAGAHPRIAGSGWDASWNTQLAPSTAALIAAVKCDATFQTWTDAPAGNEDRPMNCITWYEAMAFCAWDGGYLPTEAEWNYAAAGGDQQRAYPWSSPAGSLTLDASRASYWDGVDCVGDGMPDCALTDLVAVGSRPAGDGRWGQSDLAGNVIEWALDAGAPYPVPCADCAILTPETHRAIRGGSFADGPNQLRTGAHIHLPASDRIGLTGVRCARASAR
jgi:formylglycine-generating enzyme required for sulfatase activity